MNKQPVSYMQTDARWKNKDYSTTGESTTIAESGCGPTCAAMLIETLTGKTYTPVDACNWSLKHGYKALKQGTYYSYFVPQFKEFDIDCEMLNSSSVYGNSNSSVHTKAFELLEQGYYLIACMGKGTWTKSGHFIVVWWEDGKVRINDPASTKNERLNGDLATFKSQVKHYWAIDAREYNKRGGIVTNNKRVAEIPLKNIEKIQIYVNSKKQTLAKIKSETGADYIINGGLYNANWTPCPLLKVDGTMVSKAPYSMWGYGWEAGSDIQMSNQNTKFKNYIGSTDLINPVEKEKTDLNYGAAFAGKRGRSAMGLTKDSLLFLCSKDGSSDAMTMETLQQSMFDLGCETAIMLDGGGSSQCDFNGKKITSSRVVHNLILVYLKGNTKLSPIAEIQSELNDKYNSNLVVDGSWGPASKKAMIKAVQTEINKLYGGKLVVDGSWGPACKEACPDIKSVTKNNLAWLIQACLVVKGYDVDLDASYGPACANVIKQFQKKNGISADGICGANTFTKLLTS